MHKILIIPLLLLIAFIIVTVRADASPAIFPEPTLSSVTLATLATVGDIKESSSSTSSQDLLPGTQPVGDLVAISWNEIAISGDQTFFSRLFDLPSYNETWTQFIARQEPAGRVPGSPTKLFVIRLADCPSDVFCVADRQTIEPSDCRTCHPASQTGFMVSGRTISRQSLHTQSALEPIVDCEVCHIPPNQRDHLLIRGAE